MSRQPVGVPDPQRIAFLTVSQQNVGTSVVWMVDPFESFVADHHVGRFPVCDRVQKSIS